MISPPFFLQMHPCSCHDNGVKVREMGYIDSRIN